MTTLYNILSLCASQSEQYDILFRYDRSLESVFTVLQDNAFSTLGIIDQTGKLLGIVDAEKVLQTITKHRYDNIERMQQSNGKFHYDNLLRVVLDESPMLIILKDWDGRFLMVNKALASLYNTTPEEIIGKTDGDFNPNVEQVAFYKQNIQDIMRLGETCVVYEESTDSITGETHYYQSIKKPLKDAYNNDAILVIANDITDIKKTQQKIEQSERRLGYALEAIKEGVWDWDIPSGKLLHNATWYTMLGYNDDEMKGTVNDFIMCLHEDDKESVMNAVNECLSGKSSYVHEHRMQTKEGGIIWVHDRGNVVERDENGAPLRMVGSFANITERKLAEEALKELNARLEEKVNENVETIRQKDQMLLHQAKLVSMGEMMNAIAHQWRQPLNAIGLIIQDIREESRFGNLSDEYLNEAVIQGMDLVRFMSQTIDNFRHFFRPETSSIASFDIYHTLEETLSIVRTQMEFHEISVNIEGESFTVEGYKDEFKQVLLNLLGNARDAIDSYREHNRSLEGKVCFRLNAHQKTLQCIDNGGGIPLATLPRIFEPYFTTKEQGKGTGIGLYMSKMIMDKMQGKFHVENNNEGACFTLMFQ